MGNPNDPFDELPPDLPPHVASRWSAWRIVHMFLDRWIWAEVLEGQGRGEAVDLGIGGPSESYSRGEHGIPSNPWGRQLLELCDGYYQAHLTSADDDGWPPDICRVSGAVETDPFPVEVPCLPAPITFDGLGGPLVIDNLYLIIWGLRRNFVREDDYRAGAEAARRDAFMDIATIGVRLDVEPCGGPVPSGLAPWLVERLADAAAS